MSTAFAGLGKDPRVPGTVDLEWLVNYLNTEWGDDIYEAVHLVDEWLEDSGEEVEGEDDIAKVEALTLEQQAAFSKRLKKRGPEVELYEFGPSHLPFSQARKLKPGAWLVHFTSGDSFSSFDRGTTVDNLFTGSNNRNRAVKASCAKNLTEELGPSEYVFGFAFSEQRYGGRQWREFAEQYGRNGVLFQSDLAVEADHSGDQQWQVLFLICSEYNAVPFSIDRNGTVWANVQDGDEDEEFEDLDAFAAAVQERASEEGGRTLNGVERPSKRLNGRRR